MTTLVDIYEAAGYEVNEDRTLVAMTAKGMQPFEIKLKVVPTGLELSNFDHGDKVTFAVLLRDEIVLLNGGEMRRYDYDIELTLPIDQIQIVKEEKWAPTRWWRAVSPDGNLWCESSDEEEVRREARPTDKIERLYETVTTSEWREEK